jgi:hypothetical protein
MRFLVFTLLLVGLASTAEAACPVGSSTIDLRTATTMRICVPSVAGNPAVKVSGLFRQGTLVRPFSYTPAVPATVFPPDFMLTVPRPTDLFGPGSMEAVATGPANGTIPGEISGVATATVTFPNPAPVAPDPPVLLPAP